MQPPSLGVGQAALDRLRQSPHVALRAVSCQFEEGVLVLRGRVRSFYDKQLAQETIARVEGVARVVNEIEVVG